MSNQTPITSNVVSSTPQCPRPKDVYRRLIAQIQERGGGLITFWNKEDDDKWVQIDEDLQGRVMVNHRYSHSQDPVQYIAQLGITFPAGFHLLEWNKDLDGAIWEGEGPLLGPDQLVETIDSIFVNLFQSASNYVVEGRVDEYYQAEHACLSSEFLEDTMLQRSGNIEWRAYREAGHAVMSFLILKAGVADALFLLPISSDDRPFLLAEIKEVSIGDSDTDWGTLTFSLRSLTTTSVVLLAGYAAERIKYDISEDVTPFCSDLTERAWDLLGSYMEEYGVEDFSERDRQATEQLIRLYDFAEKELRSHWASVEILANALLQKRTLSRGRVFKIIESNLPEATKAMVSAIASRRGKA